MYELRASKVQTLPAHGGPVTAVSYSPDGKNLSTYSSADNKLYFWQTSTGESKSKAMRDAGFQISFSNVAQ